eukprot:Colp12_sorted_trinity150504_noHs@31202
MQTSDDPFDDVLFLEERLQDEGWEEGLEAGRKVGEQEGRVLGWEKGLSLSKEVGFYYGSASLWKHVVEQNPQNWPSRLPAALTSLLSLIGQFPLDNPRQEDLFELLEKIRAKHKQISSLLQSKQSYSPKKSQMSF